MISQTFSVAQREGGKRMVYDFTDVRARWRRKNKVLFSRDSMCLQELSKLLEQQKHRTIVLWALDCAKLTLDEMEKKYPEEHRPRKCLELSEAWAKGQIKMPVARRAILELHALVKEIDEEQYSLLCRAIAYLRHRSREQTHFEITHLRTHRFGAEIRYRKLRRARIREDRLLS